MGELKLGRYKHYKGGFFEVMCIARDDDTLEELVIYKMLQDSSDFPKGTVWARSKKVFTEEVVIEGKKMPRYEYAGAT